MKYGLLENPTEGNTLYEVVHDSGEFGSVLNDYTVSGLDGDTDEEYIVFFRGRNDVAAPANFYIILNSTTVANSHHRQYMRGDGANSTAARPAAGSVVIIGRGEVQYDLMWSRIHIFAKSGRQRTGEVNFANTISGTIVDRIQSTAFLWSNSTDNLTSLKFTSGDPNALGIGTRIVVLKRTTLVSGTKTGIIETPAKIRGAWELVYENILSAPSAGIIGATVDAGDPIYMIDTYVISTTGSTNVVLLRFTGSGSTNHGFQRLEGVSTAEVASANTAWNWIYMGRGTGVGYVTWNRTYAYVGSGYSKTTIGEYSAQVSATNVREWGIVGGVLNDTSANTAITVQTGQTNGAAAGSWGRVWRLNL